MELSRNYVYDGRGFSIRAVAVAIIPLSVERGRLSMSRMSKNV